MNAQNIYDAFVEIQRLRELIDKYHKEIKRKDILIENLRKEIQNLYEQRK